MKEKNKCEVEILFNNHHLDSKNDCRHNCKNECRCKRKYDCKDKCSNELKFDHKHECRCEKEEYKDECKFDRKHDCKCECEDECKFDRKHDCKCECEDECKFDRKHDYKCECEDECKFDRKHDYKCECEDECKFDRKHDYKYECDDKCKNDHDFDRCTCMKYSDKICLIKALRKIWLQHAYWTRFLIVSKFSNRCDEKFITAKMMDNCKDMSKMFRIHFCSKMANELECLLKDHFIFLILLIEAIKNGKKCDIDYLRKKWFMNAYKIACFLSENLTHHDKDHWQKMMYKHLKMTEESIFARLKCRSNYDNCKFEKIECNAREIADMMSNCIIHKFSKCDYCSK